MKNYYLQFTVGKLRLVAVKKQSFDSDLDLGDFRLEQLMDSVVERACGHHLLWEVRPVRCLVGER